MSAFNNQLGMVRVIELNLLTEIFIKYDFFYLRMLDCKIFLSTNLDFTFV